MTTTTWNYLRLLGALTCLVLVAISVYTDRSDPLWGFIGCGSFILATLVNLEGDDA